MPRKAKETETRLNADKLSAIYKVPARTLREILHKSGATNAGGYDKDEAAMVTIAFYREKSERVNIESAVSDARRKAAEAESAEIDLAERQGKMALRSSVNLIWADAVAQGVRNIAGLKSITEAQKRDVLEAIRKIKLSEPEEV